MVSKAARLRFRGYQVGFGDCLLLTVTYDAALPDGRRERHMLIDFGNNVDSARGPSLKEVGAQIATDCGGVLDVVVASHRHQDHVRGFTEDASWRSVKDLAPKVVIRPWMDVPEEFLDATNEVGQRTFALDDASRSFVSTLKAVGRQAEAWIDELALDEGEVERRAKQLSELGLSNSRGVARLDAWAKDGTGCYVRAGETVDVDDVMPGVTVEVLGPPTLDEVPKLTSYAGSSTEYWLALADAGELTAAVRSGDDRRARPDLVTARKVVAPPNGAGAASWLLRELDGQDRLQVLDIVEGFDNVLNNTSVILLVTVGTRTLLLAGDAQAENWSLTLDKAYGANGRDKDDALRKRLANVDLYKVGHHGSRNATPMRLYDLWAGRTPKRRPLTSAMATMLDVYHNTDEGEVPKPALIGALRELGELHSTHELPDLVWWFDLEASATGSAGFTRAVPPPRAIAPKPKRKPKVAKAAVARKTAASKKAVAQKTAAKQVGARKPR